MYEECVEKMGIPNLITREHIIRAIKEIAESGVPERRRSKGYCVIYDNIHYPPKYVISQAAEYAVGKELEPHDFSGGENLGCANEFLRSKGFEVVKCKCDRSFPVGTRETIEKTAFTEEHEEGGCNCSELFREFKFEDLIEAKPPKQKGVYVIRIKNRNDTLPEAMINQAKQLIEKVGWKMLEKKTVNRVERLRKISACPTIYIGSAGTQHESKNTLKGRYNEFSGRHTAMYPIWVLLYFGWKLEFGWKESDKPSLEEAKLKESYRRIHRQRLPALVER